MMCMQHLISNIFYLHEIGENGDKSGCLWRRRLQSEESNNKNLEYLQIKKIDKKIRPHLGKQTKRYEPSVIKTKPSVRLTEGLIFITESSYLF